MKKLKVAIIGCGRISVCYSDAFLKLSDLMELTYAVDADAQKAKDFAAAFGCRYATDISEIYDKGIDVVHICLPHYLHAGVAIDGMHVLTEKPIALSLKDTQDMIAVSKETGKNSAAIGFENGCIYNLYACNYYGFDSPINIEICCEKARFGMIQDMGYTWFGKNYTEYPEVNQTESVGKDYWGTTHVMQLKDFYLSVLNDLPVKVDGNEGLKTLEIVKGIYLSALTHKRITVPFEDIAITDTMADELMKV